MNIYTTQVFEFQIPLLPGVGDNRLFNIFTSNSPFYLESIQFNLMIQDQNTFQRLPLENNNLVRYGLTCLNLGVPGQFISTPIDSADIVPILVNGTQLMIREPGQFYYSNFRIQNGLACAFAINNDDVLVSWGVEANFVITTYIINGNN